MASSRIYKLDNGKPYLNNCFPAKNLLRMPDEGRGHWLVARKCNLKKKPKSVFEAPAEGQESQKKVSSEVRGKKAFQQENQEGIPGHVLDRAFLAKEKDFRHFHSVIYINASENLLPLEAFHTFPTLKELELAFNGIKTVYVKYGDFKFLEFLDLSFNSLTAEAICDLGILPHLRVLLLTGNGLTSLPPNLAVTEQETSVTSLTSRRYILRFPALETLMLDDNKLSSPNCFASLAGLRRLKKLSLDQNRIFRIPYLQQFQLRDGSGDWVGGRGSPQKEPHSMRQPKPWMFEVSDEQPDYTVLPMKKDVDRTEVVFSSYPGFSTSEATKVCALPPIFEILPVKSLKARNQTLAPPFPELRYLSLAYNKIAKEDAILPVALFPLLCELIFHNNPLVAHTRGMVPTNLRPHPGAQGQCGHPQPHLMDAEPLGSAVGHGWTWFMVHLGTERTTDVADHLPCTSLPDSNLVRWASLSPCSVKDAADQGGVPPLLKSFLQERLGIHLISKKIVKAKHRILMPRKDSRKVKTQVPKVPKRPLILHHLPVTTVQSPSKEIPESEAWPTKELSAARSSILESQIPIEGVEGLSLSHRTFVPLPPICSDSTVYSEETMSHRSNRPGHLSPEHLSDEDTRSMESIFLTQVGELPSSILQRDDSSMKEEEQRPPHTAPREVKRAWRKLPTASLPSKYHGYEELLTAKPDPAFIEPKGIQKNAQALQRMLKCPLLCCSSKPRLGALQKHYVPKEKRAQRIPVPPPRKTRAQLLDDLLVRMRDPQNITEAPLGAVLHQRTERRLVNQKQYLEAKRLLKEFQARYRQLVRYSLRTVFRATAPPPGRPALSEGQPRFGRFLEFMDEFCQGPMASDSKS
ncbi:X-ray radiation resistance-associated protein 1 isoform X2 [Eumetopias jubatus]|uniref:X-ray radiation resistance-associated protein 1 isoform X2 n=1 Tax=Eumetopias jubatus TaxID=34886 RepID=UPI0010168176|nr:X-ray radiation resistance-associated protein 1 isoform X2 [Eumetopias jubatus]